MRRIRIGLIPIALIGALIGFGMMWVANDLLEASGLRGPALRLLTAYSATALVIFLLGAVLGCWNRVSWVFLAIAVFVLITDTERFFSKPFWTAVAHAPLFVIALWVLSFAVGIVLGRYVRVWSGARETSGVHE